MSRRGWKQLPGGNGNKGYYKTRSHFYFDGKYPVCGIRSAPVFTEGLIPELNSLNRCTRCVNEHARFFIRIQKEIIDAAKDWYDSIKSPRGSEVTPGSPANKFIQKYREVFNE